MEKNNPELLVEIEHHYGKRRVYPICEKARIFAELSHTSTITEDAVEMIKRLGFTFKVKETQL